MSADIEVVRVWEGTYRMDVRGEVEHDDRVVTFLTVREAVRLVVKLKKLIQAEEFDLA